MPGGLKEIQIHPARTLVLPDGGRAEIDVAMVPVIQAFWGYGLRTLGCCQDLGESIEHNGHGSPVAPRHRQRHADFYQGRAWLKMPVPDANRLIAMLGQDPVFGIRVRRWTHPEAWQCTIWVFPTGDGDAAPASAAQINFPAAHIDDVVEFLRASAAS
jgi:hypothetical protein